MKTKLIFAVTKRRSCFRVVVELKSCKIRPVLQLPPVSFILIQKERRRKKPTLKLQ